MRGEHYSNTMPLPRRPVLYLRVEATFAPVVSAWGPAQANAGMATDNDWRRLETLLEP
jgi:hypothetical protein